jgi:hypothetical protein
MTPEQRNQRIAERRAAGALLKELAFEFGLSIARVCAVVREHAGRPIVPRCAAHDADQLATAALAQEIEVARREAADVPLFRQPIDEVNRFSGR